MSCMILAISLLFLNITSSAITQHDRQSDAVISGNVYDNRFGLPIPGAKAMVLLGGRIQQQTTTDQWGGYEFKNLSDGQYTVSVQSLGFASAEVNVQVRNGERIVYDIALKVGHLHDPIPIEISGTARLADNAPSSDVNVVVISPVDHQIVAKTKTNKAGHYVLKVNDPGQYVVSAFKSGFHAIAFAIVLNPELPRKPYSKDLVLFPLNLK